MKRFFGLIPKKGESRIWNSDTQIKKWYSPDGGIICWNKKAGESVNENEVIAKLYSRKGIMELKSPFNGILLLKNPTHAPHERQEIAKFLVE